VRVNFVIVIANLIPSPHVNPEPTTTFVTVTTFLALVVFFLVYPDPASTGNRVEQLVPLIASPLPVLLPAAAACFVVTTAYLHVLRLLRSTLSPGPTARQFTMTYPHFTAVLPPRYAVMYVTMILIVLPTAARCPPVDRPCVKRWCRRSSMELGHWMSF
jgi:hypothetical protein